MLNYQRVDGILLGLEIFPNLVVVSILFRLQKLPARELAVFIHGFMIILPVKMSANWGNTCFYTHLHFFWGASIKRWGYPQFSSIWRCFFFLNISHSIPITCWLDHPYCIYPLDISIPPTMITSKSTQSPCFMVINPHTDFYLCPLYFRHAQISLYI